MVTPLRSRHNGVSSEPIDIEPPRCAVSRDVEEVRKHQIAQDRGSSSVILEYLVQVLPVIIIYLYSTPMKS